MRPAAIGRWCFGFGRSVVLSRASLHQDRHTVISDVGTPCSLRGIGTSVSLKLWLSLDILTEPD